MITNIRKRQTHPIYRMICALVAFTFVFSSVVPPSAVYAQVLPASLLNLPAPGTMVPLTGAFTPPMVDGITVHPNDPFMFDFIIGRGDDHLEGEAYNAEAKKLIKYFLAALTVPEEDLWVNLSPYEKDRIIPESLSRTEMGRDLLAQDYILKQLTASLMYPENELGDKFWKRIRSKIQDQYGHTNIPVDTFNKVWIVPQYADIYETENTAIVMDSYLEVMLEKDYMSLENSKAGNHSLGETSPSSQIIKEVILPEIEREVNEGETFANLRQVYNSMILATWYKQNLNESLLGQVYVDQSKIEGIDTVASETKDEIYAQYVKAFNVGVYNYIREEYDANTDEIIPRKYFAGGAVAPTGGNLNRSRVSAVTAARLIQDRDRHRTRLDASSSPVLGGPWTLIGARKILWDKITLNFDGRYGKPGDKSVIKAINMIGNSDKRTENDDEHFIRLFFSNENEISNAARSQFTDAQIDNIGKLLEDLTEAIREKTEGKYDTRKAELYLPKAYTFKRNQYNFKIVYTPLKSHYEEPSIYDDEQGPSYSKVDNWIVDVPEVFDIVQGEKLDQSSSPVSNRKITNEVLSLLYEKSHEGQQIDFDDTTELSVLGIDTLGKKRHLAGLLSRDLEFTIDFRIADRWTNVEDVHNSVAQASTASSPAMKMDEATEILHAVSTATPGFDKIGRAKVQAAVDLFKREGHDSGFLVQSGEMYLTMAAGRGVKGDSSSPLNAVQQYELTKTVRRMVPPTGGIMAADESIGSAKQRLDMVGLENTYENREIMRNLMLTTVGIEDNGVNAVILADDTYGNVVLGTDKKLVDHIAQRGIAPGIKTDKKLDPDPDSEGEKIAKPIGLEELPAMLAEFKAQGAVFTKWRTTQAINTEKGLPTNGNIRKNGITQAKQSKMAQEAGLVPIFEPEVELKGHHNISASYDATVRTIQITIEELEKEGVWLPGAILKTSMILSGDKAANRADPDEVGYQTLKGMLKSVPSSIPAIVFLSGGQADDEVNLNLDAIIRANQTKFEEIRDAAAAELRAEGKDKRADEVAALMRAPWQISYSFGRGLQRPALLAWGGDPANFNKGQAAMLQTAREVQAARLGKFKEVASSPVGRKIHNASNEDITLMVTKALMLTTLEDAQTGIIDGDQIDEHISILRQALEGPDAEEFKGPLVDLINRMIGDLDDAKSSSPVGGSAKNLEIFGPLRPRSEASETSPTSSEVGGIDLDSEHLDLKIERDGNGIPLPVSMQPLEIINIQGLVPVILNVAPVSMPLIFGANFNEDEFPIADTDADKSLDSARNEYFDNMAEEEVLVEKIS